MSENGRKKLSLREIQRVGLDMLIRFDDMCRKNGLTYFLSGGTLLGAVRHQGFIPWDDDVDVMMPRPDYERFKALFLDVPAERYAVRISDAATDYATPYLRLFDTKTRVEPSEYLRGSIPHLFLDIFPIEGLPDDVDQCRRFYGRMRRYDAIYQASRKGRLRPNERNAFFKRAVGGFAHLTGGTVGWCRRFDRAARKYPFGETKHAGVCLIAHYGMKERMPFDAFAGSTPVTFEGRTFPAPQGWDTYLKGLYGDYMKLPPEEKRRSLHMLECELID